MKKHLIIIAFIFLANSQSFGQLIDVLQVHAGTAFFPSNEKVNSTTLYKEDIYAGYSPAQTIGVGASKFLTDKFQLGVDVEYMQTFKPNYSLNNIRTAIFLKFNLIPPDIYKLSPYIIASGNFLFVSMSQTANSDKGTVTSNEPNTIQINTITNRYDTYSYKSLVFGGGIGAGLDYNFYSSYSLFAEGMYNYNFAKSSSLQDPENTYTAHNKSQLTYVSITVGIRIYMY